jgi:hypothetical protein
MQKCWQLRQISRAPLASIEKFCTRILLWPFYLIGNNFLVVLGFKLRASHMLDRHSTTWAMPQTPWPPSPFFFFFGFSYFSDNVSYFCLGQTLDWDSPTFASHTAGITSTHHHVWLAGWDSGLANFFAQADLEPQSS